MQITRSILIVLKETIFYLLYYFYLFIILIIDLTTKKLQLVYLLFNGNKSIELIYGSTIKLNRLELDNLRLNLIQITFFIFSR